MADAPKNLEDAILIIDDLNIRLTTANQTISNMKVDVVAANESAERLKTANAELNQSISLLKQAIGSNGGGNLPKEVTEDIRRRVEMGLSGAEATNAALRQHQHNIDEAKRAKQREESKAKTGQKLEAISARLEQTLRFDGPTVSEYLAAGYDPAAYPPAGYASKSTPSEIDGAIKKYGADKALAAQRQPKPTPK